MLCTPIPQSGCRHAVHAHSSVWLPACCARPFLSLSTSFLHAKGCGLAVGGERQSFVTCPWVVPGRVLTILGPSSLLAILLRNASKHRHNSLWWKAGICRPAIAAPLRCLAQNCNHAVGLLVLQVDAELGVPVDAVHCEAMYRRQQLDFLGMGGERWVQRGGWRERGEREVGAEVWVEKRGWRRMRGEGGRRVGGEGWVERGGWRRVGQEGLVSEAGEQVALCMCVNTPRPPLHRRAAVIGQRILCGGGGDGGDGGERESLCGVHQTAGPALPRGAAVQTRILFIYFNYLWRGYGRKDSGEGTR
eukprot:356371-Chlamydomonas_euryale.AAC.1